ncbi:DNA-binding response regulator, NarL/FixJ family, contains REC and HTH domains [Actinopolymorpha cephalotaxi]|uniref:DNA-binding NarL/FixJ family response regulator n=1 Tax=Actinopolymorpha cephalotaxi TaxID=504797 RepID=A0A1I2WDJ0_9ACTN|nr:response regulator transcription factor [Actinopolymorpha cephalotaxi]NYH82634.1 DNA-binding NarL/FixJ family response regulator [Actinopolymorpha cephalotaxi]SFG99325.1 DNA-binding response regulator, NarL/FixJ family, contains REC and HTH domains [Actinopolymorpha cephalotaxi]
MIRVLVVDDEALVRSGLRMILEAADDVVVVAEARDGRDAIAAVSRHRPDVVLMDVRMPELDGVRAAAEIGRAPAPSKVIMLTTFDLDEYVHAALRAGAVGFLLKDTPPRDLVAAVRTVAAGNAMLAPEVTKRLISSFADRGPSRAEAARERLRVLTGREHEVVRTIARGLSNAEIGRELAMSEATVKAHVSRSLAKLSLDNRVQAAILVHEADLA